MLCGIQSAERELRLPRSCSSLIARPSLTSTIVVPVMHTPPLPPPPLQSLLGLLKRVSSNNGMIVMSRTWNKERNLQSLTCFKPSLLLWPPQYNAGALFSSLRFWETGKPLRLLASKCVIWLWAQLKVEWLSVFYSSSGKYLCSGTSGTLMRRFLGCFTLQLIQNTWPLLMVCNNLSWT